MELILDDLADTERFGTAIAGVLKPGDCVLLEGPLGAGKTALARALLRAAMGDPALEVPSPSYTLVQTYHAPTLTLHHLDLWRLDGPDGLAELGWDEMRRDVMLIEWPERLKSWQPAAALTVSLSVEQEEFGQDGHQRRRASVEGWPGRKVPWSAA